METVNLIGSILSSVYSDLDMPLNYFYGSPLAISNTLARINDQFSKYPCIVVFDEFQETKDTNNLSHFDRTAEVTMFFMDIANKNWTDEEHIANAIAPMNLLADLFIEEVNRSKYFGKVENEIRINRSLWGLYLQGENGKKPVFPDLLSGVELRVVLPIKKSFCNE